MADEGPRSRGVVAKFINSKGYGFIKQLDDGSGGGGAGDLFFHQSEIISEGLRMLKKGQVVEFFVVRKGDKIKAVDVTVVNDDRNDSGESNSSGGGGGGSNRRNDYSSGGGKCSNCRKIGRMVRDCDTCGGGGAAGGGSGGVLVVEAPSAKVVGKTDSRSGGGGGGDSRHLERDGDKVGVGVLVVEAPVAKVVGKTDTRGGGGGGDSRHLGRDGVLALKVPVGKTGNRVGGGDSRRLARSSKNVGDNLAVKEVAVVAKVVPNISLHVGGGMRVRGGGGASKHLDRDCDKSGVGKVVGDPSMSVNGIESGHLAKNCDMTPRVLEVETVFAKLGIYNNIDDQRGHMANDRKDFCYICDKPGHTSSDCKGFCYNCDQYGHMASDCPGFCYNCDQYGHMASDCPGFCYNCDRHGHMASECPGFCYNCDRGHMASDCPGFCYNCDQHGHMASECPGFCYNCIKPGHMASDCPGF